MLFRSVLTGLIAVAVVSVLVLSAGGLTSQSHVKHMVPATEVLDGKQD